MYGLAILLLVREANGSFAVAGRVVGAFGLANALGAVVQGRLMDRFGQPPVLRRAAAGHVAMLVALVVAAAAVASPAAAVLAAAAIAGAGGLGFSATAASRRWQGAAHAAGPLGPLHSAGVRTLFAVLLGLGA